MEIQTVAFETEEKKGLLENQIVIREDFKI